MRTQLNNDKFTIRKKVKKLSHTFLKVLGIKKIKIKKILGKNISVKLPEKSLIKLDFL